MEKIFRLLQDQIQPAILKGTAIGFDLSKNERVERAAVLDDNLDNHLVLVTSFFNRITCAGGEVI